MREWTAQRMDTLRTMWNEGKSSTQISQALGGVSRNAVMGKVDRMGLMRSALHNTRMTKTPMGACRSAMAGVGRGRLRLGGAGRSVEVEAVEPVAAFVVAELDAAVQALVEIVIVPETIAPLDVIDSPPVVEAVAEPLVLTQEMAVPAQEEMVEKVEEALAPPVTERAPALASESVEEARATSKPKRTAADLAKALKASRAVKSVKTHAERASRTWKGPLSSPSRTAPREPASFSMPPKGLMARVKSAAGGIGDVDHRTAVAFVKEMGDGMYDASRRAHQAALVAIATVLSRGDPRRILVPFMSEPLVLQMMRSLAEKAVVVAGKPPERWMDAESGDRAFFDDVMLVEGPLANDRMGFRFAA